MKKKSERRKRKKGKEKREKGEGLVGWLVDWIVLQRFNPFRTI